jgi:hypothetical protein
MVDFDGNEINEDNFLSKYVEFNSDNINKFIEFNSHNINKFIICCQNGYLDEAKKLYGVGMASNIINKAFQDACLFGRFDIVKWLYSIKNKPDISDNNYFAFINASFYGHLDILQWLYTLQTPINQEDIFKYACRGKQEDVVKWLITIHDEYDYEIINTYIIPHGFTDYERRLIKKIRNMENQLKELQDYNNKDIITDLSTLYI